VPFIKRNRQLGDLQLRPILATIQGHNRRS
jgi:hypothetical protein